ncbi:hypothetical protein SAMN05428997_102107 [Bosea sp. CRIB-10]|uniref:DUF2293 domain-containing protein n=1 Tax=Bosea sp. CRIB-10 TaxID=378404 RepID=UPI0008F07CE4|nr:DUF2293 domain-containing protein [Bosea sp. CRIB-10]SFB79455.1 hypothetical protein SAMN05428997_102107 [Bosea sp. CRIB-10]
MTLTIVKVRAQPVVMVGTKRQQAIRKALRALVPGIPLLDAETVLALAGRAQMRALPPSTALWLALGSHVRHSHTDYDRLLAEGYERDAARYFVADAIDDVLSAWGCQRSILDEEGVEEGAEQPH